MPTKNPFAVGMSILSDAIDLGPTNEQVDYVLSRFTLGEIIKWYAKQNTPEDERLIAAAREMYHRDGKIEIDPNGSICSGSEDDGDYVLAWVWVSNDEAELANAARPSHRLARENK